MGSNTAHDYADRYEAAERGPPTPPPDTRPAIRSTRTASSNTALEPARSARQYPDLSSGKSDLNRSTTFEGPTQLRRDASPVSIAPMSRVPSDSLTMRAQRSQLRPLTRSTTASEMLDGHSDDSTLTSSPDRSYRDRSASPATSHGSTPPSRSASYSTLNSVTTTTMKQAPPPPPSRSKKPPPPPPPMKRSALSTNNISYA